MDASQYPLRSAEKEFFSTPTNELWKFQSEHSRVPILDFESLKNYAISLEKNLRSRDRAIADLHQQAKASYWIDRIVQLEGEKDEECSRTSRLS